MDEIKYREYVKLLNDNKELQKKVYKELIKKGIDHNLKGFYYLLDIISLCVLKRKHSFTPIKEIFPFIAHKYGIKEYSVQRQLRYTCTIRNYGFYVPNVVCFDIWKKIIDEENEKKLKENN